MAMNPAPKDQLSAGNAIWNSGVTYIIRVDVGKNLRL